MTSDHAETATVDTHTSHGQLIGYDTDTVTTAVQRLYSLENAYREDGGECPEWIPTARLLLEDVIGRRDVHKYGGDDAV